jgi:hypothetical protein
MTRVGSQRQSKKEVSVVMPLFFVGHLYEIMGGNMVERGRTQMTIK